MKKLILILLFVFFYTFPSGQWIFIWSMPGIISLGIDSEDNCVRYDGEVKECNQNMLDFMKDLKTHDDLTIY